MNKPATDNFGWPASVGFVLRNVGALAVGLVVALFGVLRELLVSPEIRHDEERRLHDSDLSGELNHRTGRFDAGTDPYGWYDD
jgi:hypothetical protein|tara:strand:+ start:21485 stop:21733 length:249 start_codon:yes stop_codon:yes gene_type:complete